MLKKTLLAIAGLVMVSSLNAQTILDVKFGSDKVKPKKHERIAGTIQKGWSDNSKWNNAWIKYSIKEEKGITFQRVNFEKGDKGATAQFTYRNFPKLEVGKLYKVTVKARNLSDEKIELGLRMHGKPYKFPWQVKIAPSKDWKEYTYEFSIKKELSQKIGIWIVLRNPGIFDIANIKFEEIKDTF